MLEAIAIIGGGQAAAVAARNLRRRGYDGRVEIIGAERHRPYQRPPLSKEYLAADDGDDLFLLPERWCAEQDVRLRLGVAARRIRPEAGAVELADGTEVAAGAVLIATGGRPRALPGVAGDRIHYLRTVDDSDRLRERLRPGARLIVIGAGFIGSEVAATARARGAEVVVVEALDAPMAPLLGARVGAACAEIHRRAGATVRLGERVESITETGSGVLVTTTGGPIAGDAAVVGVGIEPNTAVAADSGIAIANGVLVDDHCRTDMPNVYAAGDVANLDHPLFGERIRAEHFDNASRQARAAADAMLGRGGAYEDPYWFWSDQYERNLQYTGHARGTDDVVIRGSLDELEFTAFYLRDGVLRAAFAVDRGADVMAAKELVAARARVDPAVLADEDTDLMELSMPQELP